MKTQFQKEWIAKQDTTTPTGYAKAIMLREKYDLMNTETLWLDDWDDDMIVFVGNHYNYEIIERNKKGLKKVADKIHGRFNKIKCIWFGPLLFEY